MANVQLLEAGATPEAVPFADVVAGAVTGDSLTVLVRPEDDVRSLRAHLPRISEIQLLWPTFKDGRTLSSARILRDHLGFTGRLRAIGHIVPDNVPYLIRSGVDVIELRGATDVAAAARSIDFYAHVYQKDSIGRVPVWALRHPAPSAA
jgi:uncharacterized protein (DUF934 family)